MGKDKYAAADTLDPDLVLRHYSQPHVLDAMLSISKNKEVVGSFGGRGYARRPDMIIYPQDVLIQVRKGVTSFHVSEETWSTPFSLVPGMAAKRMDELRTGWDLIIDIDCNYWEYSKLAAHLIIQALDNMGVRAVSCKFSGNHGFHIGIPFEAFPVEFNGKRVSTLFPEAPQVIAEYLKHVIEPVTDVAENLEADVSLSAEIMRYEHGKNPSVEGQDGVINLISEKTGLGFKDLVMDKKTVRAETVTRFHALNILEIDTLLISSRHLVRHVYSINEKSGWVSIPINPKKVLQFRREVAKLENFVKSNFSFLERKNIMPDDALPLFKQAYDFRDQAGRSILTVEKTADASEKEFEQITDAIPEQFFPPCIQKIAAGLQDGRKRAMFILKNFLSSVGWQYPQIESYMLEWNKKNPDPLSESVILGSIRNLKKQRKSILPPNCDNDAYYKSIGICCPDNLCQSIRNPVNYALKKSYFYRNPDDKKGSGRQKLTEEQKAARRAYRKKKKEQQVTQVDKQEDIIL
ncbi:MAG: hypothetical protein ACOCWQ_01035 [Nanoarchaeota archaeon]